MAKKRAFLFISLVVFFGALLVAWVTQGTGVIRNDLARNISIPDELTMPLQVKAAYNGQRMFFRFRWPSDRPGIYHDMLRYDGSQWDRNGGSVPGPQPEGIYEDRLTMMVDDGSIPEFGRYGGYITIGNRMRFFTDEATADEVRAHSYLGGERGQSEVSKYLPATRSDTDDWASVVGADELASLRSAGYFLDLWHWRAHRSNPIARSDDQYIAEGRYGDSGAGPFSTNWDSDTRQPKFMLDPEKTGQTSIAWTDLIEGTLGFDDLYYISEDLAVPFDASLDWKDGDTIPRRLLRTGRGSRSDITVAGLGRWVDGHWDVTLVRAMDTGNAGDDKALLDMGSYDVAMAVHRDATGSRWHYVSLPVTLGLGRAADLEAVRFAGREPSWDQPWLDVTLFYPGQVDWPRLVDHARHPGAGAISAAVPVRARHSEEQLALYGVEMEFDGEIRRQWMLTMLAGLALVITFGVAVNLLMNREEA